MPRIPKAILTLAIISQIPAAISFAQAEKSIYGADNRIELFNASPETFKLADSVVSLWDSAKVKYDLTAGVFSLKTENFAAKLNLCPEERFREQPMGAFCSGSLVGEDLIMTAGHCITDQAKCDGTKIVFGFARKKSGAGAATRIRQEDVYTCERIITRFLGDEPNLNLMFALPANIPAPSRAPLGPDYALIQLDRKVSGHKPLAINRGQNLKKGDKMMVIGHPAGLPLKIAAGASVRDASQQGYFVTDLDTFGGNSGSPVFNTSTRLIEGILVRGDEDFLPTPAGCTIMATYSQNGGRGEDVTKVSALESFIPKPAKANKSTEPGFRDVNVIVIPAAQEDLGRRFNANFQ